ncbi:MAG TPA: VWA domain-containing protein [Candidatus Limnocylindrales bacterium]|nr:VWA domain-containing protein [Candidatus Limnocylindrales bacterium]
MPRTFEYYSGPSRSPDTASLLEEFKVRFLDKAADGYSPEETLDRMLEEDRQQDKGIYAGNRRIRLKDVFSRRIQEKLYSSKGLSEEGGAGGEGLEGGSKPSTLADELGKPGGGSFISKKGTRPKAPYPPEEVESDFYKPVPDKGEEVWADHAIKSRALQELKKMQYLDEKGRLTSKALQEMGQRLLRTVFQDLKKAGFGLHETPEKGMGLIKAHETKPYEYGDLFRVNIVQSLLNGVRRNAQVPVRLNVEDFRIDLLQHQSNTATVLIVDRSESMSHDNRIVAVRKTSLALFQLITSLYPGDQIWVVGMDSTAELIHPSQLYSLIQERLWTNMEAALRLSRKLLQKYPYHLKQIIMVTDGHPTICSLEGKLYKNPFRPIDDIIARKTLREVELCTMKGIRLHIIMLAQDKDLADFANRMAKINRGNVYYVEPDQLSKFLLVSYATESLSRERKLKN